MKNKIITIIAVIAILSVLFSLSCNVIAEPVEVDINFHWTAVSNADIYELRFSDEIITAGTWFDEAILITDIPANVSAGQEQILPTIVLLEPDTWYYFSMRAGNSAGLSEFGNVCSLLTRQEFVPPAVTDLGL